MNNVCSEGQTLKWFLESTLIEIYNDLLTDTNIQNEHNYETT